MFTFSGFEAVGSFRDFIVSDELKDGVDKLGKAVTVIAVLVAKRCEAQDGIDSTLDGKGLDGHIPGDGDG